MPVTAQAAWPPQTSLELLALPSAVPCARGHVRAMATEWGLQDLADTAELLASEITTNAIHASARLTATAVPIIRLWVACDQASITLHVWDASPGMPLPKDASPDSESGRGLLLVQTLADDRGTYREPTGKTVVKVPPGRPAGPPRE
jgi:anti-sigma regulatory factor (Ser/Thr protein kinase)